MARSISLAAPVVTPSAPKISSSATAPAEQRGDAALELAAAGAVAIGLRQVPGEPERAAARNDGHLVDRIVFGDREADDRVPGLVVGGHLLLVVGHDHRAALRAHVDLVLGALELVHADDALVGACREQRRLVHQVGQIGARETRRAARDQARLDVIAERHAPHVHAQDLLAAAHVRQRHHHLAVEAARAQQRRIQHVRTVGGGDDDDALVALEAVHLHQQLVEGLLALVVAAAEAGTAVAADRVDLVDENDARRVLLGLLEHVAHARGTDADEHLDEVGAGDGEERHLGFAGDGAGQQRLAGARRADHEHALGDLAAELLELARVLEEVDDLADLLLGLIHPGDVREGDIDLVLAQQPRAALAEGHRPAAAGGALHLPQHVEEHQDQQERRRHLQQQLADEIRLLGLARLDAHVRLLERADEGGVVGLGVARLEGGLVLALPVDHVALHDDVRHPVGLHVVEELRVGDILRLAHGGHVAAEDGEQHQDDDDPEQDVLCQIVQGLVSSFTRAAGGADPTYTKRNCMASK